MDKRLLSSIYYPPAESVFPSFCSFSLSNSPSVTPWLRLLDLQNGWRDLKIDWLKESQDQGTGAKMRAWFIGCKSLLTEKKWETDNHSLFLCPPFLSSPSSCHKFLILHFRNPNIPVMESHCWILFPTNLCLEHTETDGDCCFFKRPCNLTCFLEDLAFFLPPWPKNTVYFNQGSL